MLVSKPDSQKNQWTVLVHKFTSHYKSLKDQPECNWVIKDSHVEIIGNQRITLRHDVITVNEVNIPLRDIERLDWMDDIDKSAGHPMMSDETYKKNNYDRIVIKTKGGIITLSGLRQGVFPIMGYIQWFLAYQKTA